jgi:hypothetical protein
MRGRGSGFEKALADDLIAGLSPAANEIQQLVNELRCPRTGRRRGRPADGEWKKLQHSDGVEYIIRTENCSRTRASKTYAEQHTPRMNWRYIRQIHREAGTIDRMQYMVDDLNDEAKIAESLKDWPDLY